VAHALLYSGGDVVRARSLCDEGLMLLRSVGNKWLLVLSLGISTEVMLCQGYLAQARQHLEEALDLNRELGNKAGIADSLCVLVQVEARQGNYPRARQSPCN
jgi:hypothetical protein